MNLAVNRTIVENLLAHAASAARLVGHLDEGVAGAVLGQLADHIDAVVHELGELLGEPVSSDSSATSARMVLAEQTAVGFSHSQGDAR